MALIGLAFTKLTESFVTKFGEAMAGRFGPPKDDKDEDDKDEKDGGEPGDRQSKPRNRKR